MMIKREPMTDDMMLLTSSQALRLRCLELAISMGAMNPREMAQWFFDFVFEPATTDA